MSTDLTTTDTFVIDLPKGTVLPFDPSKDFDWSLIYAQQYMSAEWLEEYHGTSEIWPTGMIVAIGLEVVQDPERPDETKKPDIVLQLSGGLPKVVMNKTRCKIMTRLTGTRNPHFWITRLRGKLLQFSVATVREMSRVPQVVFDVIGDVEPDDHNQALFGF